MSQIPRRTCDLLQIPESTGRPPRQSRTTAAGTSRNLERPKSIDPWSSTKKKPPQRSFSATPQRTPNRSAQCLGLIVTPGNNSQSVNKKLESARIEEYIRANNIEGWNIPNQSVILKSMTTKQFVSLVKHFLQIMAGDRLQVRENYIDDIIRALNQLGYPYPMTKSWLKNPCLLHSFANTVQLFSWFLCFSGATPDENTTDYYEDKFLKKNSKGEKKINFLKEFREAFLAWNRRDDDEYEKIKQKITIKCLQDCHGIENPNELDKILKNLKTDLAYSSNKKINKNEAEFHQRDLELKKLIKINTKQTAQFDKNVVKIDALKKLHKEKENLIAQRLETINLLKIALEKQRLTREDHLKLVKKISELNFELKKRKESVTDLQDHCNKNQIIETRLTNRKIELISEFNTKIYIVLAESEELKKAYFHKFHIDKNTKIEHFHEIEEITKKLKAKSLENIEQDSNKSKNKKKKIEILEYELKKYSQELAKINENYAAKELQFFELEKTYKETIDHQKILWDNKSKELQCLVVKKESLTRQMHHKKKIFEAMEKDNEELWKKVDEEVDELCHTIARKNEEINLFTIELNEATNICAEILKDLKHKMNI